MVKIWKNGHQEPQYILQKIFDNDLAPIRKNKVTLKPNKPAFIGMCILDLSKVWTSDVELPIWLH